MGGLPFLDVNKADTSHASSDNSAVANRGRQALDALHQVMCLSFSQDDVSGRFWLVMCDISNQPSTRLRMSVASMLI